MLGRLFFGIHWVLFVIFVGSWLVVILLLLVGDMEQSTFASVYMENILFVRGLSSGIHSGLASWIPVLFLFIDYVVNGKWTWFPWQRNKD
tara:strand:+ start:415 stop:684 length:270 start_codon:yes stop_codon:yes gene_type:complete